MKKELKPYICEVCRKLCYGVCPICHNKDSKYPFKYNPLGLESKNKPNRKENNETLRLSKKDFD